MRKQYHFRKSQGGFDAWEINKLVEVSKSLPVVSKMCFPTNFHTDSE